MSKLKAAGTAVYICCGDADEDCFEGSEALFEILDDNGIEVEFKLCPDLEPVSYTHLDVYKRQVFKFWTGWMLSKENRTFLFLSWISAIAVPLLMSEEKEN